MISGWLTDRVDSRWLLFWYYGLRGLSLLFLPYAFGLQYFGLILFIVFYGLDWVATVPPTVALAADTFGKRNVGVVYGWIFASHQLGAAAAAFGAGAVRTYFGDYQLAFMTSGLLCLLAAGLVIRISRARGPQVDRGATARALVLRRVVLAGDRRRPRWRSLPISGIGPRPAGHLQPGARRHARRAPAAVDLLFSEPVTPAGRGISVYGPGRRARPESDLRDADGAPPVGRR